MADYAAMYHRLFHSQTVAIEILQKAQQDAEEMFIGTPGPDLTLLIPGKTDTDGE